MALSPLASVTCLRGVGPRVAERLARLDIHNLQDLLFHLPLRYQDRTRITPIASCHPGGEWVLQGEVLGCEITFGRRRMLLVQLGDASGSVCLRFFNFNQAQRENLSVGRSLRCFGEVKQFQGRLEMPHPEYQFVDANDSLESQTHLTAVYPSTDGLGQHSLRNLIDQVVLSGRELRVNLPDYLLDPDLLEEMGFPGLERAVAFCHKPEHGASLSLLNEGKHACQLRLAFEELLAQHLGLRRLRQRLRDHQAPRLTANAEKQQGFIQTLPFSLTQAQRRVVAEISQDMQQAYPMQRLVQGDVGSGKTVVAAIAALQAVQAGYQVVVMAPTEILAEQHQRYFSACLDGLAATALLTGKLTAKQRRETQQAIVDGAVDIVVGTHAVFQDQVQFNRIGLVVVDEQHRFGVQQRLALREKGRVPMHSELAFYPHQLIMTATPIPRTLMMTAYADLDCSVIDELPPGRQPVETVVLSDQRRQEVVQRVSAACAQGRQVYWVCTLIEESELLQAQAAESTALELQQALPAFQVGLIHGRLNSAEKSALMAAFSAGKIHLLVATTVIEVGVDVTNASLMVIENAERLGLSQLHQLRGRVGRGHAVSHCVLLYKHPISTLTRARLTVMRESNDGFKIAQRDLELRGPGEMLGTRQTGLARLRIADLAKHQFLLPQISSVAAKLESLHETKGEAASLALIRRWLADRQRFGEV